MLPMWLVLSVLSCLQLTDQRPTPLAIGTQIDNFELRDYRGATHNLSDWKDRRALAIIFLGVDCPLAKLYAPRLVELSKAYDAKGVQFIGINSNQNDSITDIGRFARTHQIPFPKTQVRREASEAERGRHHIHAPIAAGIDKTELYRED